MSEHIEIGGEKIPLKDWATTPESVKKALRTLAEQVNQLNERLKVIEEKLNQNSKNSSRPPSSDGFDKEVPAKKKKRERNVRGSKPRQMRQLRASEECDEVHDYQPEQCRDCGAPLSGLDEHPHRHQVWELPPIEPRVIEYRLHELSCTNCGQQTRANLPVGVSESGNGERLSAIVGLLSGVYRQSHAQVQSLMSELFGVPLSYGGVNRLRQEMSKALSAVSQAAGEYVQAQPLLYSDETSFPQGNRDGKNPQKTKGWLWVLVTPLVSFFEVALSRSQEIAQRLIGEEFAGIVTSDRYGVYGWIAHAQRQVCWAHLKRDLTAISERTGVSQEIGAALLRRERRLFRWWHQFREGTLSREAFIVMVEKLRAGFKTELEEAASYTIAQKEKTSFAKTVRTCRKILQIEPALWTFVYTPGVEPTNNAAERALRPAVIWRRTSYGSQSEAGSQFVSRMLTVSASLKSQERSVLEFLTQACRCARLGLAPPSLIPGAEHPQDIQLLPRLLPTSF